MHSLHAKLCSYAERLDFQRKILRNKVNDDKHIFLMHRVILRCASGTQYWKVFVCLTAPTANISSLASNHFFYSLFQQCLKRLILPEIIDSSDYIFKDMQIFNVQNVATTEFCCLLNRCHSRSMIFPFACSPAALLLLPPEDMEWWSSSTSQWTKL